MGEDGFIIFRTKNYLILVKSDLYPQLILALCVQSRQRAQLELVVDGQWNSHDITYYAGNSGL